METLQNELQRLEFAALVTYMVCLSWAIEEYQVTASLDSIIEAIGWGTDARRSTQKRQEMRAKVWRWMLLFDSLAVIGARPGTWKEPRDGDKKREKIDPDKLYSRDALLKIIGTRATEQGTFDNSAPPKEITFVAGAWVNEFRGNREILSELGDVRTIASIPRGKPSGAWAACVGFALNQKWREQAARAPVTRVTIGDKKALTQKFRPFTRRVLLAQLWRSDVDPEEILKSSDPSRAKEYWESAIEILKKEGVIGVYREIELCRKNAKAGKTRGSTSRSTFGQLAKVAKTRSQFTNRHRRRANERAREWCQKLIEYSNNFCTKLWEFTLKKRFLSIKIFAQNCGNAAQNCGSSRSKCPLIINN